MRWSEELLAATKRFQAGRGFDVAGGLAALAGRRAYESAVVAEGREWLQRELVAGDNPARLNMLVGEPSNASARPPLIILLHGCQQDAATFARESGWVQRAQQSGAVLLLPEQTGMNNASRCFNWYQLTDKAAGAAELRSIRQMIETACATRGCDPRKIYVIGLSAGGAMAAALMASYPGLFEAGAVVAGLPVGCARSMSEALGRMATAGPQVADEVWSGHVQALAPSGYSGAWPRLSVWQGEADQTVDPANASLLVRQWRAVHQLAEVPAQDISSAARQRHRAWQIASRPIVEWWSLGGMDHGYPVGPDRAEGRWVLRSQVDATDRIASFFQL